MSNQVSSARVRPAQTSTPLAESTAPSPKSVTAQPPAADASTFAASGPALVGGAGSNTAGSQQVVAQIAGKAVVPSGASGQASAVFFGTNPVLEDVPPATVKALNLRGLSLAKEIGPIADKAFAGRTTRLATAGYSAPPKDTPYEANTTAFLGALVKDLGAKNVGLVTSPTADAGSVDAISTILAQGEHLPVVYVTAKPYIEYIDPKKFPAAIDQKAFMAEPKYVFSTGERYSEATALASNAFIATGGRDATVSDFVNAIERHNPVVIVVDEAIGGVNFDDAKGRPNNGAAYLAEMLSPILSNAKNASKLPYPTLDKKGFDRAFLEKHDGDLRELVKVVRVPLGSGKAGIEAAAREAAAHIEKKQAKR